MTRKQINDQTGPTLIGGLFCLLMAIGISYALFLCVKRSPDDGTLGVLVFYGIVFGFPAAFIAGLAFLLWHRRKFGKAVLVLESFPVKVGEETNGSIEVSRRLSDFSSVRFCLKCEKAYFGHKGERVTVLWKHEWLVGEDKIAFTDHSTTVPLSFTLPLNGSETRNIGWIGQIRWRLEVETLPSNGPHFASDFFILVIAA